LVTATLDIAPPEVELERLLGESEVDAIARERSAFDAVSPASAPLVLFGAGGLGRRTVAGLRRHGVVPVAFTDNNSTIWHTQVEGIDVLPPEEAVRRFGEDATFVGTIWRAGGPHRFAHSREQLQKLGARRVVSFALLYWKYPEGLLPHYCQDLPHKVLRQREDVRRALDLWADDASRREYVSQIRWRLRADFDGLAHPVTDHPQYLPDDLFAYRDDEVLVDCGAYDGDTVRSFLERRGEAFRRIVALEPDPVNCRALGTYVESLPADVRARISVLPIAAASRRGTLYMEATGTASSAASTDERPGTTEVEAAPLDEIVWADNPSFLKMDIEGAEPDALVGAQTLIATERPVIAVCVYHQQDHLWSIPLQLRALTDDYRFFLRAYNEEGWDLICYAVPAERVNGRHRAKENA
jgi:FkbM family methyltransferase